MIRECTEAENCIIKDSVADILSNQGLNTATNRSMLLPVLLGFVAGLGLGALVSVALPISSEIWIRLVLVICIIITMEVFVLVWYIFSNRRRIKRLPGSKFKVNGGTMIHYGTDNNEEAWLIFAEDDLLDDMGNPCCIQYPASPFLDIRQGERIILAYNDTGAYIPLRVTASTKDMIPMESPDYFDGMDWNRAVNLPHPAVLDLDKTSYRMNENEVAAFLKTCNSLKSIRVKNWVGIILLSFLILFLFGLLFIGLITGEVVTEPSVATRLSVLLLLVWGFLSYGAARGILKGITRGLNKIQYKKKVLFLSIRDTFIESVYIKNILVYEYIGGAVELKSYLVNSNVFLPNDIPYGKVIYKYSKEAESDEQGLNYFALPDFIL